MFSNYKHKSINKIMNKLNNPVSALDDRNLYMNFIIKEGSHVNVVLSLLNQTYTLIKKTEKHKALMKMKEGGF
jgi:hypothetical protein